MNQALPHFLFLTLNLNFNTTRIIENNCNNACNVFDYVWVLTVCAHLFSSVVTATVLVVVTVTTSTVAVSSARLKIPRCTGHPATLPTEITHSQGRIQASRTCSITWGHSHHSMAMASTVGDHLAQHSLKDPTRGHPYRCLHVDMISQGVHLCTSTVAVIIHPPVNSQGYLVITLGDPKQHMAIELYCRLQKWQLQKSFHWAISFLLCQTHPAVQGP